MRISRSFGPLAAAVLISSPALALEVSESVEVAGSVSEVWGVISDFCAIAAWHPVVAECVPGEENGHAMRTLTTTDGGVLIERRVQYSDEGTSYSYEILESPLPVAGYVSTLAVMDWGDGALVTWSGEFDAKDASAEEATGVVTGIYRAGLEALKARFE